MTIERGKRGLLDPQVVEFLQWTRDQGPPPCFKTLTPTQGRDIFNPLTKKLSGPSKPVANEENFSIPGPTRQISIRVYTPQGHGPFPILVYIHGGGFVMLDLDGYDSICRSLANGAGCIVISVDYRLAPEHKFPAPLEDAYAATQWVEDNVQRINGDPRRIAVAGDSAGGNLAAVVSLMARDKGTPSLIYQLLVYPNTNLSSLDTASYSRYGEGYSLTKPFVEWCYNHYIRCEEDKRNPYVSPLLSQDLSDLPPTCIITAEFDVLNDEGEDYAKQLEQAGVPVIHIKYNGMIHGFMNMAKLKQSKNAMKEATTALLTAFLK